MSDKRKMKEKKRKEKWSICSEIKSQVHIFVNATDIQIIRKVIMGKGI